MNGPTYRKPPDEEPWVTIVTPTIRRKGKLIHKKDGGYFCFRVPLSKYRGGGGVVE